MFGKPRDSRVAGLGTPGSQPRGSLGFFVTEWFHGFGR